MSFWWLLFALAAPPGGCVPIDHDPITAGDLAPSVAVFGQLPPETAIAPAPPAGARRLFGSFELAALARSHSLRVESAPQVCAEWAMEALGRERVMAALQAVLPAEQGGRLEILEISTRPVPRGPLEFRAEDLGAPAVKGSRLPVVWHGNVIYGNNRRYAVWARVSLPTRPADIHRGDLVAVDVRSGGAHLMLQARAEADARAGDVLPLRNLSSNKLFRARATGKAQAVVETEN